MNNPSSDLMWSIKMSPLKLAESFAKRGRKNWRKPFYGYLMQRQNPIEMQSKTDQEIPKQSNWTEGQ
jgi:hypothetical protein